MASREQQGAYLCLSRGNAVHLAHWAGECAMVGCALTAVGLTNGKIDGGAARTDGGEGELCGTSATHRRADTADAKNAESALPENGGSAKNGEATWGAMARERKLTTKIGELLCPSRQIFDKTWGCFGGTRKVVDRKRGEMDKTWDVLTEKREKMLKTGVFWSTERSFGTALAQ